MLSILEFQWRPILDEEKTKSALCEFCFRLVEVFFSFF